MSDVESSTGYGIGEEHDSDDVVIDDTEGGVVLIEADPHRISVLIINTGYATMRITTDGSAPTPTHGKQVVAGGTLNMVSPYCPIKEVKAIRQDDEDTTANASYVN